MRNNYEFILDILRKIDRKTAKSFKDRGRDTLQFKVIKKYILFSGSHRWMARRPIDPSLLPTLVQNIYSEHFDERQFDEMNLAR